MPKPIELKIVLRVLAKKGFFFVSQKGSHAKYKKIGWLNKTVIVKMSKKEIPYGTFRSIILMSGLEESDFRN
ncbi:MAG: type II toxin-antitoxin system HicA family toxin [Candidatus Komeilibacteria bacterium]|nr:type II toxin-antitoxin system HicA family toxin [Candidatus Komeilibacteria bacterium]